MRAVTHTPANEMEDIMSRFRFRTPFATPLLVTALAIPFAAACDEDPVEPHEHADVAGMLLTVGTQTVTLTEGGAQGGLTIPNGASTITATFLDDDGDPIALHDDEFELRILPPNATVVTFARTGAFSGTLNGVADGSVIVQVDLYHIEEGHADFGPHNLAVTVE
jgi:hypothetical protein